MRRAIEKKKKKSKVGILNFKVRPHSRPKPSRILELLSFFSSPMKKKSQKNSHSEFPYFPPFLKITFYVYGVQVKKTIRFKLNFEETNNEIRDEFHGRLILYYKNA